MMIVAFSDVSPTTTTRTTVLMIQHSVRGPGQKHQTYSFYGMMLSGAGGLLKLSCMHDSA